MKKVLLGIAGVLGVAVVGFVGAASMQPDTITVSRSVTVAATPADVMPHLTNYENFVAWSPWTGRDPNQKVEYSDPPEGKDAWYTWVGNEEVGSGKMTLTAISDTKVEHHLEFIAPWAGHADTPFTVVAKGDDKSEITWEYVQQADFQGKAASLFMDMDEMLGPDYEEGLKNLQAKVEADAKARVEAEQKAAEEAAAAEQAAAEGAADEGAAEGG